MRNNDFGRKKEIFDGKLGNLLTQLENLEHEWINLEKLELEILEMSPYRTLENKAGSSPAW